MMCLTFSCALRMVTGVVTGHAWDHYPRICGMGASSLGPMPPFESPLLQWTGPDV